MPQLNNGYGNPCTCTTCQARRDIYSPTYQLTMPDLNTEAYGDNGFDADGYDVYGYDENGFNRAGYDRDGYDEDGFNVYGYNSNGYDADGYDADGYDEDGYNREMESREDYSRDGLMSWDYRPNLIFRGDKTTDHTPFYGMEIEITTDRVGTLVNTADEFASDLVYCKSDSSVDGAEMVTHPMTYDWAMANFPWRMLTEIRDRAEATVVTSENGIHIHVSRDGFSDSAHLYRWMKLWYRNERDIQRIARRRAHHWGSFSSEHRAAQAEHVKRGKPSYRASRDNTLDRYSAINTTNDDTLEVRVFASTLRPQRARAALQLVAGSVEYTRTLDAQKVIQRRAWDWQAFMAWAGKSGRYPDLVAENRIRRPV